jgi:hypothetical protein
MKNYAIRDTDGDVMTIFAADGRRDAIKTARLIDVAVGHCTGVDLCHTVDRATRSEVRAFKANLRT